MFRSGSEYYSVWLQRSDHKNEDGCDSCVIFCTLLRCSSCSFEMQDCWNPAFDCSCFHRHVIPKTPGNRSTLWMTRIQKLQLDSTHFFKNHVMALFQKCSGGLYCFINLISELWFLLCAFFPVHTLSIMCNISQNSKSGLAVAALNCLEV